MKVNILVSESCRSFGDCIRDVDAKGLISGDFVLLDGGVVGNIKFLPLLKQHRYVVFVDARQHSHKESKTTQYYLWVHSSSIYFKSQIDLSFDNNQSKIHKLFLLYCNCTFIFRELVKNDKEAAMTLLLQGAGLESVGHYPKENLLLASSPKKRILHFQNLGQKHSRKIDLPLV